MDDDSSIRIDLCELEQRHDDLLQRLDELDKQIQQTLRQWNSDQKPIPAARLPGRAAA